MNTVIIQIHIPAVQENRSVGDWLNCGKTQTRHFRYRLQELLLSLNTSILCSRHLMKYVPVTAQSLLYTHNKHKQESAAVAEKPARRYDNDMC